MAKYPLTLLIVVGFASFSLAAEGPGKLILITQSKGFVHDVVKRGKDGEPCKVEQVFKELAERSKAFTVVESSQDASILTPEKLKSADVVVFYTTGELPMKPEDLDAWVKAGGAFLGIHPATDTFHGNACYCSLIGGEFVAHPWNYKTPVTLKVLDPDHAAAKPWDAGLDFPEEIYQHKNFDPSKVHVILGLDMEKTELKKPFFVPVSWCKTEGKGKLFYTSLGHREDVWTNPRYQDHLIAAIKWLSGEAPGESTPNPDISAREEAIARKVAPPEAPPPAPKSAVEPKKSDAKAQADAPNLPKVANGYMIHVFARAPDIKSPASIAVAPDGRLFVGEDEYNTQPKRDPGLSRVKLCIDSDNDGVADKFTVFADKLNSPQGMTFVGDALFVVHAPLLTAFRDINNDGVADERRDLITGLGPLPEGLVHHVPSGLRIGIDGWLYISIGDKGIVKATGKDGRTVSLWGGGVVRVRPDGTMMELFSSHTRNTFDVSVDPLLNTFTRDNTNDGDGWDSRLTQMQRDGEYGYPSLFKNWPDEIIQPVASYGSGSATGSMYLHEPGFHGRDGDSLYTCDWARGILYRHELTRKGAGFDATQAEFIKEIRPTDLDADGSSRLYVADWGRRDWGNAGPVGTVYRVATSQPATMPSKPAPLVAAAILDEAALLAELSSPSQIRQRGAQWELLKRGPNPKLMASLTNLAMRKGELESRVAVLFTLAQLGGDEAHGAVATLAASPELREYALRALADRDDQQYGINTALFTQGLRDANPRVRLQAVIGIGHLKQPKLAGDLVPLTADADPLVRHAAMQSLRRLNARDLCIAALKNSAQPNVAMGVLRTLRFFHDEPTVSAVAALMRTKLEPAQRQEVARALAMLYHVEGKWDGGWWTPHPDTRGPHYSSVAWPQSERIATLLIGLAGDADAPTARLALNYIGLVEMKEAVPTLARMIAGGGGIKDDAARSLIATKASTPEALAALERAVLNETFAPEVRLAAIDALAALDPAKGQAILIHIATKLDTASKPAAAVLDRASDALSARAPTEAQMPAVVWLLSARQEQFRIAAATALMRVKDEKQRPEVVRLWEGADEPRLVALLAAVPRLPADNAKPFTEIIRKLLKDQRPPIRQAATLALGHIGDPAAVKDLVSIARRDRDPLPAIAALAGIEPAAAADDQVLIIATLLVENSPKAKSKDQATYARFIGAAQKFLADPRVPANNRTSLRSKLMEAGVIYQYLRSDAIPVTGGAETTWSAVFPPEEAATLASASITSPFSANGKMINWTPLTVSDPKGMQVLEMPENSVVYLAATLDAPAATSGYLSTGSDDGLHVWLNGKSVISKNVDRGTVADMDKEVVQLAAGKNTLLFRVNNHGGVAGIQARLRSRAIDFDAEEFARLSKKFKSDPARGKELFTQTLGCAKCHTTDKHEEPKGPFLGDIGGKFDGKYIADSIMHPSSKIAQGFATERIIARGASEGDYTGFVTKETADEVQMRDPSGKVTTVKKADIKTRMPVPGSMMPEGLLDNASLDDFASLLAFLQSMK